MSLLASVNPIKILYTHWYRRIQVSTHSRHDTAVKFLNSIAITQINRTYAWPYIISHCYCIYWVQRSSDMSYFEFCCSICVKQKVLQFWLKSVLVWETNIIPNLNRRLKFVLYENIYAKTRNRTGLVLYVNCHEKIHFILMFHVVLRTQAIIPSTGGQKKRN